MPQHKWKADFRPRRAWSNWRAASASDFLLGLIERGQLKPQASDALDRIYEKRDASSSADKEAEHLYLSPPQLDLVVKEFQLSKQVAVEVERALGTPLRLLVCLTLKVGS